MTKNLKSHKPTLLKDFFFYLNISLTCPDKKFSVVSQKVFAIPGKDTNNKLFHKAMMQDHT